MTVIVNRNNCNKDELSLENRGPSLDYSPIHVIRVSGWSTKFSKLFWRVADRQRQIFEGKQKLSDEKFDKHPLLVTSSWLKKLELCCDVKRKEIFVQICRR